MKYLNTLYRDWILKLAKIDISQFYYNWHVLSLLFVLFMTNSFCCGSSIYKQMTDTRNYYTDEIKLKYVVFGDISSSDKHFI